MTVKKAIRYIDEYLYCTFECDPGYTDCIDCGICFTNADLKRVLQMSKEALEKQIPKKPHRNYRYLSDYWCECGWHLGRAGMYSWCPNCGNKIDWSEE